MSSSRRSGIVVSRSNNNNKTKPTPAVSARASKWQCVRDDINYAPVALVEDEDQQNEDEKDKEDEYEEEDQDEEEAPKQKQAASKRRGRPVGSTKRRAPASEDGIEDQLQPHSEPKKGRGRPRKEATGAGAARGKAAPATKAQAKAGGRKQGQARAQVESEDEVRSDEDNDIEEEEQADGEREEELQEEDEDPLPTPEDLMDKRRFHSYSKFKLPADSEDDTADDLTFAVGKTVALRAPAGTKTEWLARIDYIAAANQALVYCLVTWFYLPAQLKEVGIPVIGRPKMLKGEVFLSDHREVIETSTVDSHVKIDFHPNYLPAKSDYFYRKQVVTKPETHKELGGKGRFYRPYITDVPEE